MSGIYRMAAAGFLLLACSDPAATQSVDSGVNLVDASSCAVTLDECDGQCPQTEQTAQREAAEACQDTASWRSLAGECGDFRYVETDDGVISVVYYFDAQGKLVAGKVTAIIEAYCSNSSFDVAIGPIPACVRSQDTDLCL